MNKIEKLILENLDEPFAVFVVSLTKTNMIAATTRAFDKSEGGKIGLPGGKIDMGENPKQAAYRESKEEGWDIEIGEKIHEDYIDGKLIFWYKGMNPKKLINFKEKNRIKPIEVTIEDISSSGYGNEFIKKYLSVTESTVEDVKSAIINNFKLSKNYSKQDIYYIAKELSERGREYGLRGINTDIDSIVYIINGLIDPNLNYNHKWAKANIKFELKKLLSYMTPKDIALRYIDDPQIISIISSIIPKKIYSDWIDLLDKVKGIVYEKYTIPNYTTGFFNWLLRGFPIIILKDNSSILSKEIKDISYFGFRDYLIYIWLYKNMDKRNIEYINKIRVQYGPAGSKYYYTFAQFLDELINDDFTNGVKTSFKRVFENFQERKMEQIQNKLQEYEKSLKLFPDSPYKLLPKIEYINNNNKLKVEGERMEHCVGGFGPACEKGDTFIYKLPNSTAEVNKYGRVIQHRGINNSEPPLEDIGLFNDFIKLNKLIK